MLGIFSDRIARQIARQSAVAEDVRRTADLWRRSNAVCKEVLAFRMGLEFGRCDVEEYGIKLNKRHEEFVLNINKGSCSLRLCGFRVLSFECEGEWEPYAISEVENAA